ncbi:hypothetical protein SAMN05216215_109718 [Saccharopolyspora shandongensis]|uniref:Uncharacterized protein n=1 Tax=Saccharopolyspora shandongensis TaxID=418495 RepID=A0A1H3TZ00_9PSEU|nr:hypothetical protein [Saccharopolyspora shandongensis]SDZ55308.1 hypothetical protein SAMN05216215_109718 [Saccharopolyspora shandongensis]
MLTNPDGPPWEDFLYTIRYVATVALLGMIVLAGQGALPLP